MPVYNPGRLEYAIDTGYIAIIGDAQERIPAYWAHPRGGQKFSSIALLHDWWGMNDMVRRLAHFFAQMGYYVIVPDLFNGAQATTPREAMQLLDLTQATRYAHTDAALSVLERHHRTTHKVAAIGIGMGGTLALEASIKRPDLEAAVAYGGFPQAYLGQFNQGRTPIMAFYGSEEPYTRPVVVQAFRAELAATALAAQHRVEVIEGIGHDFFLDHPSQIHVEQGKRVLDMTLDFLERYLEQPQMPPVI